MHLFKHTPERMDHFLASIFTTTDNSQELDRSASTISSAEVYFLLFDESDHLRHTPKQATNQTLGRTHLTGTVTMILLLGW